MKTVSTGIIIIIIIIIIINKILFKHENKIYKCIRESMRQYRQ